MYRILAFLLLLLPSFALQAKPKLPKAKAIEATIRQVNINWQASHPLKTAAEGPHKPYSNNSPFWDNAAYHTGNMEVWKTFHDASMLDYSYRWAEGAEWKGARGTDPTKWKYSYGEKDEFALFGDWQICFQTYCDLAALAQEKVSPLPPTAPQPEEMIARAREVMEYEMSTSQIDYWWWADGLYMVMPVMTKLYKATNNPQYIVKLGQYWCYAKSLMYDAPESAGGIGTSDDGTGQWQYLFFRDGKYVYPKHKSANGKKDFWARGDGWVLAALARVLNEYPEAPGKDKEIDLAFQQLHQDFEKTYREMAAAVRATQQPEGYWTRSILDPDHAPGPETSGTAFFTYGLLWGINHGYLDRDEYLPCALKAWDYLTKVALQKDGTVGYVQPIGERAIPGQTVDAKSTANFGVGAFLLAACEMYRLVK